jgi:thiamine pyrophosphate-dependent acetolactate synthase large subunit-like protein
MNRLEALEVIAALVTAEDLFVTSVGGLVDDWWNLRPGGVDNTFSPQVIGSNCMLALGLAVALPHRRVVALDTDGSVLMNVGSLCTLGNENQSNLTIVVLDNGVYESVGGHRSHTSRGTNLAAMAAAAGCRNAVLVSDVAGVERAGRRLLEDDEFGFLVLKIESGSYPWPAENRKPTDGWEDKYRFMRYVEQLEGIIVHSGVRRA